MAELIAPPTDGSLLERNAAVDEAFAKTMASGMKSYETAVSPIKQRLFTQLSTRLPPGATVVELGLGTFPNAQYYSGARGLDLIGIDPNDAMEPYARDAFAKYGLEAGTNGLRVVHGVAEALPLAANSADAVVCTLTLCSVVDPKAAIGEILRVLKPKGTFLFLEHVLSEDDAGLAATQRALTPLQVVSADGCHLDRRTLETIRAARGWERVDAELTSLRGFWYLSPTAAGLAVKA